MLTVYYFTVWDKEQQQILFVFFHQITDLTDKSIAEQLQFSYESISCLSS